MATPTNDFFSNASYIQRLYNDPEREDKISLAYFVGKQWAGKAPSKTGNSFFVGPGTAAAYAGIEILSKRTHDTIYTNLVPFAWHVMDLLHREFLTGAPSVKLIDGSLDTTTGVIEIENGRSVSIPHTCFIYSPFGVNKKYVTGHRNKDSLNQIWTASQGVILLSTFGKLLRDPDPGNHVKKKGKIAEAVQKFHRPCHLVVPDTPPKGAAKSEIDKAKDVLTYLTNEAGIEVHRAPKAPSDSVCRRYLEHLDGLKREK
jgi:hypothetical protein